MSQGAGNSDDFAELTQEIFGQQAAIQEAITDETKSEARLTTDLLHSDLKVEELKIKLKEARHRAKTIRDNRRLRKNYARRALNLAELAFVFWVIVFSTAAVGNLAFGKPPFSDQALMTFTAGATVNVFVAFVGIIKGLFPVTHMKGTGATADSDRS